MAYAHYAAMCGQWLYDEVSCLAIKATGTLSAKERPEPRSSQAGAARGGAQVALMPEDRMVHGRGGFEVFVVEDHDHEGVFSTAEDPWLPEFADADYLRDSSFVDELESKLLDANRYRHMSDDVLMEACMAVPKDAALRALGNQRIADAPVDRWGFGGVLGNSLGSTFAGWVDLWHGGDFAWFCPDCGGAVFPGRGCSGLNAGVITGRCSVCGKTIRDEQDAVAKVGAAMRILRRHQPRQDARRPYRLDTVLRKLGVPLFPAKMEARR